VLREHVLEAYHEVARLDGLRPGRVRRAARRGRGKCRRRPTCGWWGPACVTVRSAGCRERSR